MNRYLTTLSLTVGAVLAVAACGEGGREIDREVPGETVVVEKVVEVPGETVVVERVVEVPGETVVVEKAVPTQESRTVGGENVGAVEAIDDDVAKLVRQQRIVVRTVDMGLVVSDVQESMDWVASVAHGMGGWTVSSERADDFSGRIAVRVPAERLDEAIAEVRDIAVEVEAEISTSKDVTAEYFDSESRLRNLRATETAMLNLLERAPDAKDALEIRKSLSEVQEELEVLQGRLKFLEETSAFSLMNVAMRVQQVDLRVNAGADRTVSVGQTVRFRANFRTPDDSSDYNVEWDFGDRTPPVVDAFTAPTTEPGTRVTASVTHVFDDYRDSPFFVDVKVYGASQSSPLFGQDTIKVTVIDTEQMPVDAGENQTAAVGRDVRFRAFFEPPEGIDQFTYTWDFGDGSAPASGDRAILTEDSSRMVTAVSNHVYSSAAESPYIVQIKMIGSGEAGVVEGSDKTVVTVTDLPVIVVSVGDAITVEEEAEAELRGTFNRPAGVTNMRYQWRFGDGSAVEEGAVGEDNVVITSHRYTVLQREPYVATLTIFGDSQAGAVIASTDLEVRVIEGEGWVVGGYNLRGNTKDAVRLLSWIVKGIVTAVIWVMIFSPLWGGFLAAIFLLNRYLERRSHRPTPAVAIGRQGLLESADVEETETADESQRR